MVAAGRALHPSERATLRQAARPARARAWRQAALIAAPIVALLAGSAGIGFTYLHAESAPSPASANGPHTGRPRPVPAAPDAAMLATASPAIGTTGTAELPPEPVSAPAPVAFDISIVAAAPFSTAGISAINRGRALECLATAIYYEAASEPDDGQRAVAQVVLNRVRHPAFPATVCGVIYQGSERTSGCQFSFACDGAMARAPSRAGLARATRNAAAALAGQVFAPVGLATHYHTYAVTPAWNRTLVMTDAVGAHFFHRWKGYWGTPVAFSQHYRGDEPVPGPHPRPAPAPAPAPPTPMPGLPTAPVTIAATPVRGAVAPIDLIRPEHRDSGTALVASAGTRLPDSGVLDRWRDSGKPLR